MIGDKIVSLLRANTALLELVDEDSIFPYIANEKTPLPLIIYTIDSLDPEYTKDGWAGDTCDFSIVSFSDDYAKLQAIVAQIRVAIELEKVADHTQRIILTGFQEGYNINEEVFLNKLIFSVKVFDY